MAAVNSRPTFRFDGRPSPARSWDIRFRVAAVAGISASLLAAPAVALIPLGAFVLGLLALARCRLHEAVVVIRGFLGFLLFFLALGVLFEPTVAQALFLGIQSVRLLLLLLLGHVLYLTATPADVTEGIRWYLGWLGPRRAWAAASMAAWALASVPMVLDQAASLQEAAALRGLKATKHPLRMLNLLTLALLVRTIGRSVDLTAALEARGFGRAVPPPGLRGRWTDAVALAATAGWTAASWAWGSGAILGT